MFWMTTVALLLCMIMTLSRALRGPSVLDRITAANSFGTKTALLIAVWGFLTERPDFLDLALVYAMMNFISTIAVLRFSRSREVGSLDQLFDDQQSSAESSG